MSSNVILPIAVLLITVTSTLLLIIIDWRIQLGLFAIQYVGVFILVSVAQPYSLAIVKLVSGWIAAAVLGIALSGLSPNDSVNLEAHLNQTSFESSVPKESSLFMGRLFYFLTAILVILVAISSSGFINQWIPKLNTFSSLGGAILLGMGLLQINFFDTPYKVIIGLLTFVSGFEIIYASLENSILILGLLAVFTFGIAFVGAYMIVSPTIEENK